MQQILITATFLAPLIVGLTALIKTQLNDFRFLPVINVIAGILLGLFYAMSFIQEDIVLYAWAGFVAGLAAGGLFDLGSSVIHSEQNPPDYDDGQEFTEGMQYHTDLKDEE